MGAFVLIFLNASVFVIGFCTMIFEDILLVSLVSIVKIVFNSCWKQCKHHRSIAKKNLYEKEDGVNNNAHETVRPKHNTINKQIKTNRYKVIEEGLKVSVEKTREGLSNFKKKYLPVEEES